MQAILLLSLLAVGTYSAPYIRYDPYRPQVFQKPIVSSSFGNGFWPPNPLHLAPAYFRPYGLPYAAAPAPAPAYVFAWPPSAADGSNAIGSSPYGYQYTVQLPSASMEPPVYEFKDGLEDAVAGDQEDETFVDAYHKPSVVPMPPAYDGETPLEVHIPMVAAEQIDEEQGMSAVEDVEEPQSPQPSVMEDDEQVVNTEVEVSSEDLSDRTGNKETVQVTPVEAFPQVPENEKIVPVTEVPIASDTSDTQGAETMEDVAVTDDVKKTSEEDATAAKPTEDPENAEVEVPVTTADFVSESEDYDTLPGIDSQAGQSDTVVSGKSTSDKVEEAEAVTESTLVL